MIKTNMVGIRMDSKLYDEVEEIRKEVNEFSTKSATFCYLINLGIRKYKENKKIEK